MHKCLKIDGLSPAEAAQRLVQAGITQLRLVWCDVHGRHHGKTFVPQAFEAALADGFRMAGTLMLKDSSGRTALPVFDAQAMRDLGEMAPFAQASDVALLPDWTTLQRLPWDTNIARMRCAPLGVVAQSIEPRRVLKTAVERLKTHGFTAQIGLELEFHVYAKAVSHTHAAEAAWPCPAPKNLNLLHPGYQLLSERHADACQQVFTVLQNLCDGFGLPLVSLEIEMGPSQFEAVFAPQTALAAADAMALFREAAIQALARIGLHTSFACRMPFANAMSSGWHLHQSLLDGAGDNAFACESPALMSPTGMAYLAGLLHHTQALCAVAVPSANGYERFKPNQLAPSSINWGADSRSALLRVAGIGQAIRIENRLAEPSANPYLCIASQLMAGLDGVVQRLDAQAPNTSNGSLPPNLAAALQAGEASAFMKTTVGSNLHELWVSLQNQSLSRHKQAAQLSDEAALQWCADEYFAQI